MQRGAALMMRSRGAMGAVGGATAGGYHPSTTATTTGTAATPAAAPIPGIPRGMQMPAHGNTPGRSGDGCFHDRDCGGRPGGSGGAAVCCSPSNHASSPAPLSLPRPALRPPPSSLPHCSSSLQPTAMPVSLHAATAGGAVAVSQTGTTPTHAARSSLHAHTQPPARTSCLFIPHPDGPSAMAIDGPLPHASHTHTNADSRSTPTPSSSTPFSLNPGSTSPSPQWQPSADPLPPFILPSLHRACRHPCSCTCGLRGAQLRLIATRAVVRHRPLKRCCGCCLPGSPAIAVTAALSVIFPALPPSPSPPPPPVPSPVPLPLRLQHGPPLHQRRGAAGL